ncbi:MAG: choice-of-anchor V domain-containing protein, partial [Pyrinomonadaceae bacterium]
MRRTKIAVIGLFCILSILMMFSDRVVVERVKAFSSGPPAGYTGAPGEITCTECHAGSPGNGQFTIIAPATYTPGATYQITVRHITQDPTRIRWGFELTSLSGSERAGTLVNTSNLTQTIDEFARQYIEHSGDGTFNNQSGGAEWTFNWTAPVENVGTIDLWAAGNQANGDGSADGDQIYTAMTSIEVADETPTPTATPTATPQGFEGDVAPRPDGNGSVISGDVIQMRRFATGLDTPSVSPNEFQRADTAPRSSSGDGAINSGDVIQARRYATGLDPATPAAGPTAPATAAAGPKMIFDDVYSYLFGRQMLITSADASPGGTATLDLDLTRFGDEAAASFTIEFDPTWLRNPRISLNDGALTGAVLSLNSNRISSGRLGVLVDSAESFAASPIPKSFLSITFDVDAAASAGDIPVRLTDALAPKAVSDTNGRVVSVRYADGA